jgi:hypothetical protein
MTNQQTHELGTICNCPPSLVLDWILLHSLDNIEFGASLFIDGDTVYSFATKPAEEA